MVSYSASYQKVLGSKPHTTASSLILVNFIVITIPTALIRCYRYAIIITQLKECNKTRKQEPTPIIKVNDFIQKMYVEYNEHYYLRRHY
jgi:hypothetical protein